MKNNKQNEDRPITIRISNDLYNYFVQKALERGQREKRIVKISEIMREAMEKGR